MEPSLQTLSPSQTLDLVLHTLCALSAAMHLDPVNSDFFKRNGLHEKLAEDLCLLGCFGALEEEETPLQSWADIKARPLADLMSVAISSTSTFPLKIKSCLRILGFLNSMANGTLHRDLKESLRDEQELTADIQEAEASSDPQGNIRQWPDQEER